MANLPTGTVTFLFIDIEGSTKLAQAHPEPWETLRERHHAILQSAVDAQDDYVFQIIGDAFCAAFHTASNGLHAALDARRKLQTEARGWWIGLRREEDKGLKDNLVGVIAGGIPDAVTGTALAMPEGKFSGSISISSGKESNPPAWVLKLSGRF